MDECTVGFRERRGARAGSLKKKRKKRGSCFVSQKATHRPECCPSQFTWAVCGRRAKIATLFHLKEKKKKWSRVTCMMSNKDENEKKKKKSCVDFCFSWNTTCIADSVSVKIYILYSCKKIHIERNHHNFKSTSPPWVLHLLVTVPPINNAWTCKKKKKKRKENLKKKTILTKIFTHELPKG